MEYLLFERVVLPLVVVAIPSLLGWIIKQLNDAARDRKAQHEEQLAHNALSVEADIASMYDRLESLCGRCVEKGCCSLKERKNIALMFDVYQRLGGNHGLEVQVKAALDLQNERNNS